MRLHDTNVVTVFESGNVALVALAKSILDGAEILYVVKGEYLQNVTGTAFPPFHFNPVAGPVAIQVNPKDESIARELLAEIDERNGPASPNRSSG